MTTIVVSMGGDRKDIEKDFLFCSLEYLKNGIPLSFVSLNRQTLVLQGCNIIHTLIYIETILE